MAQGLTPQAALAQNYVVIEDLENAPVSQPSALNNFAQAFPAGTSPVENFTGTAGYMVNDQPSTQPVLADIFPDTPDGTVFSFFHSDGLYGPEAIIVELSRTSLGPLASTTDYTFDFLGAWGPFRRFNDRGRISLYGVRTGTSTASINTTSTAAIANSAGVDFLGTTGQISTSMTWNTYTIGFTTAHNYDRMIVLPERTTNFGGEGFAALFDRLRIIEDRSIKLVKTANLNDGGDGVADAGDEITYSFTVENAGNVNLTNIDVTDTMLGGVIRSIPSLTAGATETFDVIYTLTQADVDAGQVSNTASATGDSPAGPDDVTDTSGTAADNDDPTVVTLTAAPNIDVALAATVTTPTTGSTGPA